MPQRIKINANWQESSLQAHHKTFVFNQVSVNIRKHNFVWEGKISVRTIRIIDLSQHILFVLLCALQWYRFFLFSVHLTCTFNIFAWMCAHYIPSHPGCTINKRSSHMMIYWVYFSRISPFLMEPRSPVTSEPGRLQLRGMNVKLFSHKCTWWNPEEMYVIIGQ